MSHSAASVNAPALGQKIGPQKPTRTKMPGSQKSGDFSPATDPISFTRPDWTEFRDLSRISNKSGVPTSRLPRVVVKELVDNALDSGGGCQFGPLACAPGEAAFFVQDDGPGIAGTDEEIALRFSISRPLTSSKTLRGPKRGMLGNGTRVVSGAVLCSGGGLKVSTRGRTLTLVPQDDGSTAIASVVPWSGSGTRVEVVLRGELAKHATTDAELFGWAQEARDLAAAGTEYKGNSSPWWYDDAPFWEMLQAAGALPVEQVVAKLDGCTARPKAKDITGDLLGRQALTVTRSEASALLVRARDAVTPVTIQRMGKVGKRDDYYGYGLASCDLLISPGLTVPVVIEAWANRAAKPGATVCVNRTPIVTDIKVRRDGGSDYAIFGAGLNHCFSAGRKGSGEFRVVVNVTTPFIPLTSTGKDPDLSRLVVQIVAACQKAIRIAKHKAPTSGEKVSQKDVILKHLAAAAASLSGNGTCLFSLRQLFYAIRPHLIRAIGREPSYGTFSRIIGEHEDDHGDIDNLYRDDRGCFYHPHTKETIHLGTRAVSQYRRPLWGFNKVLYCEKEGFFPILQQAGWPERFDCALLTSKGYATRAVLSLLRLLVASGEPITFYLIHDADGPGTVIYESLAGLLGEHGIEIIDLGLNPDEAIGMGLDSEPVTREKGRVPTGTYLTDDEQEWLQTNRIELNAMTTPDFIDWLTEKLEEHDTSKVVPPDDVVRERLFQEAREAEERRIKDEVLREANIPARVEVAMAARADDLAEKFESLVRDIPFDLESDYQLHWSDLVRDAAGATV